MVNIVLEYNGCVTETKWYNWHFIKPKLGDKCYKLFIAFYNLDLVKYSNYIKLSKVLNTIKYVKCLTD